ncbi:Crp/Fnr family transcriptional regulator [Hymenobacter cellulosivorans]|uniref:Crp/Fnr family transcriptional regulator n=1 Tax=Hymenobacter cellulosivorans TaxID=2932249 RepID=A0ABY4FFI1_9BACT|nr:Crp/Fnr family transcriptional regulator [Hymenobacter cellulosivorans]UOQ54886.1 Crp/Fnr family transcriptional regulator [Hymenobacter cellulosivorans]
MFELFANYLRSKATFTAEEIAQIEAVTTIKRLRKRQFLLQEGEVWNYNAFVADGCLRTYSVDTKGAEHILTFAVENWWIGDLQSLASGLPARFNIDAIEDSVVLLIRKEEFDRLCQAIPALQQLVNALLHRSFLAQQNRIHTTISYSAEEKYRIFLQEFPVFARRIPQHMVASYLGMTTETLSRIRRNLV